MYYSKLANLMKFMTVPSFFLQMLKTERYGAPKVRVGPLPHSTLHVGMPVNHCLNSLILLFVLSCVRTGTTWTLQWKVITSRILLVTWLLSHIIWNELLLFWLLITYTQRQGKCLSWRERKMWTCNVFFFWKCNHVKPQLIFLNKYYHCI